MSSPTSRLVDRFARSRFGFPLGLVAVATLSVSVASCGGGSDAAATDNLIVATLPTTAASPGEQVYTKSCAKCHGASRQGKPGDGPALDAPRIATLGDQTLRITITTGKGKMKGFPGLTQQQVDDLVAFLKS